MVGIVVVSHSRALARAAVALAEEMVHGKALRLAIAAGLDERTFGTDAVQIVAAIEAVDDGDGVVVLMDLGSAVLSAEFALELLDEDARRRVVLCPAPLVEGLVVAAVAASGGAGRDEVAAEAAAALAGKQSHLSLEESTGRPDAPAAVAAELVDSFVITNPHGLHARPAARLVQEVRTLDATVSLRNLTTGSAPVPASSLSRVATLGALQGHEVEVAVSGSQAREALDHVLGLARRGFDEPLNGTTLSSPPLRPAVVGAGPGRDGQPSGRALPASPGVAVGPAFRLGGGHRLVVPDARSEDEAAEWRQLLEAIASVRRDIQRVRARTAREIGEADAAIFDAHLLLLDDGDLLADVRRRIEGGQAAAPALDGAVNRVVAELAELPDEYLQARAGDVRAVGDQVLCVLLGVAPTTITGEGVLVCADLSPAQAAQLDAGRVRAVVLAQGSPTSHSAILARAKGIPAVVSAGPAVLDVAEGTRLAVDGGTGEVVVDPDAAQLTRFQRRAEDLDRARTDAWAGASSPAVTRDGINVQVGANVGSVEDAQAAQTAGADLAGLVRTEFLFLGRAQAPDVEEQEKAYLRLAEALEGRRITLRTLDVGGDKPLDYLATPTETNPFLGMRGLRLSLAQPALFEDQLLAIVRTAHATPVSVMFPMVTSVEELYTARRLLDEAVQREGKGEPAGLEVGIMVEVPATALKVAAFAPHLDFFSVGTNDLTQYALAAERGNHAVAALGDPYDPGVLRLVGAVCEDARGALVSVCGELAADPEAAALLVGLGVRELSVAPGAVPFVKQAVRAVAGDAATALARRAVAADSPATVRSLAGQVAL